MSMTKPVAIGTKHYHNESKKISSLPIHKLLLTVADGPRGYWVFQPVEAGDVDCDLQSDPQELLY